MNKDYESDFSGRSDLKKYGDNALLLYVLELFLDADDIDSIAANSLTDHNDDKKCDLLHVDRDRHMAIIAQGYYSSDPAKKEAKANKAADLNTAATWLLKPDTSDLPDILKSAGKELIAAISNETVNAIEFWYVHNLPESKNVERELRKVTETAHALIKRNFPAVTIETISHREFGKNNIEKLFRSTKVPIKIEEEILLPAGQGFTIESTKHTSFVTYVTGDWLKRQFDSYGTDLFSANIREYLGSRKSKENINNEIKETARNHSKEFFAYNNGITAIVNDLNFAKFDSEKKVILKGMAIVNGAQTTGALSSSASEKLGEIQILARFVKYHDKSIIENIIKYNNTQNAIAASDFRSKDEIQTRLRSEFASIPNYEYLGARRGGAEDYIKRPPKLIPADSAAQALASFHQDPGIAYNEKRNIWINDKIYAKYFSDHTTASHIVLCFSLLKAIEETKSKLKASDEKDLTKENAKLLDIFRKKGSTYLFTAAIASCMEIILQKPVKNAYALRFSSNGKLSELIDLWQPVIDTASPFFPDLNPSLESGLNNTKTIKDNIIQFQKLISSTSSVNKSVYSTFAKKVSL